MLLGNSTWGTFLELTVFKEDLKSQESPLANQAHMGRALVEPGTIPQTTQLVELRRVMSAAEIPFSLGTAEHKRDAASVPRPSVPPSLRPLVPCPSFLPGASGAASECSVHFLIPFNTTERTREKRERERERERRGTRTRTTLSFWMPPARASRHRLVCFLSA